MKCFRAKAELMAAVGTRQPGISAGLGYWCDGRKLGNEKGGGGSRFNLKLGQGPALGFANGSEVCGVLLGTRIRARSHSGRWYY